ncbi:2-dehydro-3-deoxy-D-gluconate 5-dehydrogenase [compost metagenome]
MDLTGTRMTFASELFASRTVVIPGDTIPAGRRGEAADVTDVIVFLTSDAARYVAGICLPVDGGYLTA